MPPGVRAVVWLRPSSGCSRWVRARPTPVRSGSPRTSSRPSRLANPELNEECLLDRLDDYSNDELVAISDGLEKENSADQADAEAELAEFKADLEICI